MSIGAIIIGDEILSGRRQDRHFARAREILKARGLELAWCTYLGDDRQRLTDLLRLTFASGDIVFSFGGIGVTPDDHTRQAAAAALGVDIALHPEARREIESRFGADVTPERLMLGEFPRGARIVPNPYNRIPGFACGSVHFLPGFPEMAWPMMEWVLDTWYRHLQHRDHRVERSLVVHYNSESKLLDLMQRIERDYPAVKVFSLPSAVGTSERPQIEFGAKGEAVQVEAALLEMRTELSLRGIDWEDKG
jgi:molybdopterin-biosynthesis enzyme MoeA-like protein